jgi:hypothetical protein
VRPSLRFRVTETTRASRSPTCAFAVEYAVLLQARGHFGRTTVRLRSDRSTGSIPLDAGVRPGAADPAATARRVGQGKVTTTLGVYAHLYADDHADAMTALGAIEAGPSYTENVVPLWG